MQVMNTIPISNTGLLPALVNDYLAANPKVAHLYKYQPNIDSFKQIIADKQRDVTDRVLLADVLQTQYADIETSDFVTQNILSINRENTFTVVAAHQPALFLGPLFTIYKIAATVNLANQLKQQYPEYNFVPVFWMGSEDHDIDELNNTNVNGKKLQWADGASGAVGRLNSDLIQPLIDELKSAAGENDAVKLIEDGVAKHSTIGKFTQYLINALFKHHGLVVIDQDDERLKRRLIEVLIDEAMYSRANEVLADNIQFLEENYKAQATPRDINIFYLGDGYRERIVFDAEKQQYFVNNKALFFTRTELINEISNYPENFSPNVFFRPLYQEILLPNLAFVGGAGELSYWLELKPLFEYYKVNYPALIMRSMAAIVPPSVNNKLDKLGLAVADFFGDIEQLIKDFVVRNTGSSTSLAEQKEKVQLLYDEISAQAEMVDPTLVQSVAAEKQKALTALDNLEGKMIKAEKRKQETAVNQIRSIHGVLFPNGMLQERTENFIPYYTPSFIDECVANLNPLENKFTVFLNN